MEPTTPAFTPGETDRDLLTRHGPTDAVEQDKNNLACGGFGCNSTACVQHISGIHICAVPRKYANSVVKCQGINLVGLGKVLLGWEILKVSQCVEATDGLTL